MTETASGDTFKIGGVTFASFWVGDNSGYYVWRSSDDMRSVRKADGVWRARVEGAVLPGRYPTLKSAMWAAAQRAIPDRRPA